MRSSWPWRMRSRNGWRARAGRGSGRKVRPDGNPGAEAGWCGHATVVDDETSPMGEHAMPKVKANQITINYEQQGTGEPLLLIPYLAADNACYAFQVADYAKEAWRSMEIELRGIEATSTDNVSAA